MFIMKNLTDFHKTVETSVDPPLDSDNYYFYPVDSTIQMK